MRASPVPRGLEVSHATTRRENASRIAESHRGRMTALIHRSVFDVPRTRHGHPPGINGFMVLAKLDEMAEKPR
ncbi:hypothetical protein [Streptomyces sp. MB09-02B]|uniref:hypothetical protein n=1 Tax=Streptomyces sp. MB09-02B TaxID=3028667 RepID=UPI0029BACC03|nr:hypothetical protein [Streptomyces sp. MB09-02B]MDX3640834.1 hypothetical protein [Streptomyces sp. MB09-02B]